MEIYMTKQMNGSLLPSYNNDYDRMKKLKLGQEYKCVITRPRNYKFLRKYWALINMLFDNQERYNHIDDLREDLTIEAGFFTKRLNIHGEEVKKANSIAFANMDEFEFSELYNKTLDEIVKHFHFNKEDIINNVERYF